MRLLPLPCPPGTAKRREANERKFVVFGIDEGEVRGVGGMKKEVTINRRGREEWSDEGEGEES
jgi:hypothetical protein